jgi:hypothetical protein
LPFPCLFLAFSLPVPCLFLACFLPFPCLFPACFLPAVPCLFLAFSFPFPCLFIACSLPAVPCLVPCLVPCMFLACSLPVRCLFLACLSLPVPCLFLACSLPVPCLFLAFYFLVPFLFLACLLLALPCLFVAWFVPVSCLVLARALPFPCVFLALSLPVPCLLFLACSLLVSFLSPAFSLPVWCLGCLLECSMRVPCQGLARPCLLPLAIALAWHCLSLTVPCLCLARSVTDSSTFCVATRIVWRARSLALGLQREVAGAGKGVGSCRTEGALQCGRLLQAAVTLSLFHRRKRSQWSVFTGSGGAVSLPPRRRYGHSDEGPGPGPRALQGPGPCGAGSAQRSRQHVAEPATHGPGKAFKGPEGALYSMDGAHGQRRGGAAAMYFTGGSVPRGRFSRAAAWWGRCHTLVACAGACCKS